MKLIISLFFFILISCDTIQKNEVFEKLENTKNIIEEKAKKNIDKLNKPNEEKIEENLSTAIMGLVKEAL